MFGHVRDEYFNYAIFDEVGSSPSSIEAGRAVDAFSAFPGYTQEQSDAVSAYTLASWDGMRNPVCPVIFNLYQHP